jgi:hypothetical protein
MLLVGTDGRQSLSPSDSIGESSGITRLLKIVETQHFASLHNAIGVGGGVVIAIRRGVQRMDYGTSLKC